MSINLFDLTLALMYKARKGRGKRMEKQKLTEEKIRELFSQVLRDKNREAISVIKMIKTRISTEKGRLTNVEELPEEDILKIVKRELKEIRDTVESLRKAGMEERIPEEERKIEVLETLLPAERSAAASLPGAHSFDLSRKSFSITRCPPSLFSRP